MNNDIKLRKPGLDSRLDEWINKHKPAIHSVLVILEQLTLIYAIYLAYTMYQYRQGWEAGIAYYQATLAHNQTCQIIGTNLTVIKGVIHGTVRP